MEVRGGTKTGHVSQEHAVKEEMTATANTACHRGVTLDGEKQVAAGRVKPGVFQS